MMKHELDAKVNAEAAVEGERQSKRDMIQQTLDSDGWVNLHEGVQVVNADGEKKFLSFADASTGSEGGENFNKFGVNNGQMAALFDGKMYWAPYSSERAAKLVSLGLEQGSLGVPFSNGGAPENPETLDRMREMIQSQKEQDRAEDEAQQAKLAEQAQFEEMKVSQANADAKSAENLSAQIKAGSGESEGA